MLAAAALLSVSCQKAFNEGGSSPDGTAKVSVDLSFPTIQTRAYSDGTTAKQLQYAVYMKDNAGKLQLLSGFTKTTEEINLKKEVSFQLVTGHTYGFVFWAANASAPYSVVFGPEGATMTIDDKKLVANAETLDAFYAYKEIEVKGDVGMQVQLRRPFAQINVGTNDYDAAKAAGYVPTESHIQLSSVYTTLDLVNGNVGGEKTDLDFAYASIPTSEKFPVESTKYKYMAMVYALVGADEPVVEVSFDCMDAKKEVRAKHKVGSVPVKRNHRTNIYGQLLTSNAKVIVEIVPAYDEPDYVLEYIADGVEYDAVSQTFSISSEAGLRWVADQVNSHGADSHVNADAYTYGAAYVAFVGQKVVLTKNIDLNNVPWTPIGYETKENGASIYAFAGTFDGANNTISNLTIDTEQNSNAGLFGATNYATIQNLTLENVKIDGHYKTAAFVADAWCTTVDNCHVKGGAVTSTPWATKPGVYDDANNVGGIVGYLCGQPDAAAVTNCSVDGLQITAFRKVAGIVGVASFRKDNYGEPSATISGCTVKNTTITADMTQEAYDGYASKVADIGKIVGNYQSGTTMFNNSADETVKTVTKLPQGKFYNPTAGNQLSSAARQVGYVSLTSDLTRDDNSMMITSTDKPAVLDLNGYSLTAQGGTNGDGLVLQDNSNITIKNGTINPAKNVVDGGCVIAVTRNTIVTIEDINITGPRCIANTSSNNKITIKSGTYKSEGATECVYYYGGTNSKITIEGGYFESEADNPVGSGKYYTLNIKDDKREAGVDVRNYIEVKGGEFVNFNPADCWSEGEHTNFVADGYKVTSYEREDGATVYVVSAK